MKVTNKLAALILCVISSNTMAEPTIKKFLTIDEATVSAVKRWQQTGRAKPIVSDDGVVYFPFGQYQPKVVCSLLKVCDIALQPGEKITDTPSAGDDVRWGITKSTSGSGDTKITHVVVKPKDVDIETNLIVRTDRRVYNIELVSRAEGEYMNQIAFYYPNDLQTVWRDADLKDDEDKTQAKAVEEVADCVVDIDHMDLAYDIKGGSENTRPKLVFNNGVKTCIMMPTESKTWEAAAFVIIGTDKKKLLTNYRVNKQWYIIDKVFDHGALIIGADGAESQVDIVWKKAPKQSSSSIFGFLK